jgi:disulfide bond formation protein DsbB
VTETVSTLNYFLALGTIGMQVLTVVLLGLYFYAPGGSLGVLVSRFGVHISLALTFAASVLTLVYSEVFGFVPCGLCWLQRVFLYPQVLLLGMALWKKDVRVADYSIGLSILGALVALYQHYIQMGGAEFINCPVAGADCAKRILFEFGYITFPLMSFSAFALLIVIMLFVRKRA